MNRSTASDVPPIVQEVQHQGEVLNNHEDRITNNENDIKELQNSTGTQPSASNTVVRTVTTPSPQEPLTAPATSEPSPTSPINVVKSTFNAGGSWNNYCTLVYSDGSESHVQATLTQIDNGQQHHSQDNCSDFIGNPKP